MRSVCFDEGRAVAPRVELASTGGGPDNDKGGNMDPQELERLTPDSVIVRGMRQDVLRVVIHPAGTHPSSPISQHLMAVELCTRHGSRWYGTSRAWIGSDLRCHLMVDPRDEVLVGWEVPS